jgi:SAM-dependent methyltransferase
MDHKLRREKEFHELRFRDGVGKRPQEFFYQSIVSAKIHLHQIIFSAASLGGRGLEFGCSTGEFLADLINIFKFDCYGIDISENAVISAKKTIIDYHPEYPIDDHIVVMDANNLDFNAGYFDFCFGQGVLHHLNFPECIQEIHRVLKPSGLMIFMEPLGTNPIINFYRLLTPNDRSVDEYPFTRQHLSLIEKYFDLSDIEYFGFFTLPAFIFGFNPTLYELYMYVAEKIDKLLFKIPGMWRFAWVVVFKGIRKNIKI